MKMVNLDKIINKDNLIPNFKGSHTIYNFKMDNDTYYFKEVPNRELVMEMISKSIAFLLGIPYLKESIAILNDKYGLLSKSYLKDDDKSYNLHNLMQNYFYENNDDELLDYRKLASLNNLEDIWFALEDRYEDKNIVKNLMDGITNIFMFDLLVGESDRTLRNIEIIESYNTVTLAPLYDTSSILADKSTALGVDEDDYLKSDLDKLDKFIENSDTAYKEKFYSYLNTLDSIGIEKIIEETERENDFIIDNNLKNEIITKFNSRINLFKEHEKRVSISK
ncbi:MAG TPA: hypothetical protein IAB38_01545 [Candidatus Onthousia excrementipullorum]|uniref:Uncharacterized protein n=1 Tax=Candidatus Onthousia excrementipullorum TaxID=2840884 RepID=A0A9D1DTL4_9FIRM|nr:hypothetical protein [Candidatus Onthousia excrementipullorum]